MNGRMLPSIFMALSILGVIVIWILSGLVGGNVGPMTQPPNREQKTLPLGHQVRVRTILAETPVTALTVSGQTKANRTVVVRAAITGEVAEVLVKKGQLVSTNQVIVRLKEEERPVRLAEARTLVHRREIEYEAAKALEQKAFASRVRLAEAESALSTARAQLAHVQVDLDHTRLLAPFAGIVETCPVTVGDFVPVGGTIATIVDFSKVVVGAEVTEREVAAITPGSEAEAVLSNGQRLSGNVSYISKIAMQSTNTFPIEVSITNKTNKVRAGLTAELHLPRQRRSLHAIPPSALTFDRAGRVGIKAVIGVTPDIVTFFPVKVITSAHNGILWIAGSELCLPPIIHLITVGQEFVTVGQIVKIIPETVADSGAPL